MAGHVRHQLRRRFVVAAVGVSVGVGLAAASPASATYPGRDGRLAYVGIDGAGRQALFTIRPDGSSLRQITHLTDGDLESPDWSPDGKSIAFDSDTGGTGIHVFMINVDGSGLAQLTFGNGEEYSPAWSPDGSRLVIERLIPGKSDGLYLLDVNSGAMRKLTQSPFFLSNGGFDSGAQFSPDGRHIAFTRLKAISSGSGLSAVFVMRADGTHLRQLTSYQSNSANPDWSPDGGRIVFNDKDDAFAVGGANIFTVKPNGRCLHQVTHALQRNWYNATWSPTGHQIVVSRFDPSGSAELWVLQSRGHARHPVISSDTYLNQADWQSR